MTMLAATTPDELGPDDHPIRRIRQVVEEVLPIEYFVAGAACLSNEAAPI
jgi:hypothetical protein